MAPCCVFLRLAIILVFFLKLVAVLRLWTIMESNSGLVSAEGGFVDVASQRETSQ